MDKDALKYEVNYQDLIDSSDAETIRNFKYNGKDESILYAKFLSPLAQWIVDNKVPPTIA
jgi:hypothetical protein